MSRLIFMWKRLKESQKYWLQPDVELAHSQRLRGRELAKLQRWIEDRQEWFLEKWNEHFEDET